MFDQRDILSLQSAGIDDLGQLIGAAADYVRRHPLSDPSAAPESLSPEEVDVLRSAGALGLDSSEDDLIRTERANLLAVTAEYARMVASADTVQEVAARLGVSSSHVRRRVVDRSLYAVDGPSGRVFPRFQFGSAGPVPGLDRVLAAIRTGAHPLAVERFFVTPTPDLESELADGTLCPRDWLLSGNSVGPVVMLASEV